MIQRHWIFLLSLSSIIPRTTRFACSRGVTWSSSSGTPGMCTFGSGILYVADFSKNEPITSRIVGVSNGFCDSPFTGCPSLPYTTMRGGHLQGDSSGCQSPGALADRLAAYESPTLTPRSA